MIVCQNDCVRWPQSMLALNTASQRPRNAAAGCFRPPPPPAATSAFQDPQSLSDLLTISNTLSDRPCVSMMRCIWTRINPCTATTAGRHSRHSRQAQHAQQGMSADAGRPWVYMMRCIWARINPCTAQHAQQAGTARTSGTAGHVSILSHRAPLCATCKPQSKAASRWAQVEQRTNTRAGTWRPADAARMRDG